MSTKQKMKRALGWLLGRRWILWALAAVIGLLMACVAVYLAWRGFRLLTSEEPRSFRYRCGDSRVGCRGEPARHVVPGRV